jgi:hypothetical protein
VTDLAGIDLAPLQAPGLAAEWSSARPFPHVVIDGFTTEEGRRTLALVARGRTVQRHLRHVTHRAGDATLLRLVLALGPAEVTPPAPL